MKSMDVRALALRHRALDREIHKLDRRGSHMTPQERERSAVLKKQRLFAKDRLQALRQL